MTDPYAEYVYFYEHRRCEHVGCRNVITHYLAAPTDRWAPVWCRRHAREARRG